MNTIWESWRQNAPAILAVISLVASLTALGMYLFASKQELYVLETKFNMLRVEYDQNMKNIDEKLKDIKVSLHELREEVKNHYAPKHKQ